MPTGLLKDESDEHRGRQKTGEMLHYAQLSVDYLIDVGNFVAGQHKQGALPFLQHDPERHATDTNERLDSVIKRRHSESEVDVVINWAEGKTGEFPSNF
jgi:hypothetical protein